VIDEPGGEMRSGKHFTMRVAGYLIRRNVNADSGEALKYLPVAGVATFKHFTQKALQLNIPMIDSETQKMKLAVPFTRLYTELNPGETHFAVPVRPVTRTRRKKFIYAIAIVMIGKSRYVKVSGPVGQLRRRDATVTRSAVYMHIYHLESRRTVMCVSKFKWLSEPFS
jgi:hypothetical protein